LQDRCLPLVGGRDVVTRVPSFNSASSQEGEKFPLYELPIVLGMADEHSFRVSLRHADLDVAVRLDRNSASPNDGESTREFYTFRSALGGGWIVGTVAWRNPSIGYVGKSIKPLGVLTITLARQQLYDRVMSRAYGEPVAEWFMLLGRSNSAAHQDVGVHALDQHTVSRAGPRSRRCPALDDSSRDGSGRRIP
jgi:hypothetical protein